MTLSGIDISSYQAGINLDVVPSDFVFIKATEGTNYVSPACNAQTASAQRAGKKVGWYHFASVGNAIQQADYFVNNISNYVRHGILMLDWEASAITQGVGWAKTWLDHVYQRTGVRPIIYMSKSTVHQYNWASVANDYGLFFAQYANYNRTGYQVSPWTDNTGLGAWNKVGAVAFQYSSSGSLRGWTGNLDLDVFYGDKSVWDKYAGVLPAAKFNYKIGDIVTVRPGQTKNNVGYDIRGWVGQRIEIVKTRTVNGKAIYDGKVGNNPFNDLTEANIQPYQDQAFKVGDWVQLLPTAFKETNGYDLRPRHNWIGQVAKVTFINRYSNSNFEYQVKWQNGTNNVHIAQQDLKKSEAPKPTATTAANPAPTTTESSNNAANDKLIQQAIAGLESVANVLKQIK